MEKDLIVEDSINDDNKCSQGVTIARSMDRII